MVLLSNDQVAKRLEEIADLLEAQRDNPFRVRAYRRGGDALIGLDRPVHRILVDEGIEGLVRLPGIGESLARSIVELVYTGDLGLLGRLRGAPGPARVLSSVPGLGRELAVRIHERLGIDSLAELELAARDGRLESVPGVGRRRLHAVRESLAGRPRRRTAAPRARAAPQPPVSELLDVDREYREKAEAGVLPRIASWRSGSGSSNWLPVLHTRRGVRRYAAVYSNTPRARELGRTRDWVVIRRDDHLDEGHWTIVTERDGKRVVRGREAEITA